MNRPHAWRNLTLDSVDVLAVQLGWEPVSVLLVKG